jgi:predicted phage terminase large subunit-like protein
MQHSLSDLKSLIESYKPRVGFDLSLSQFVKEAWHVIEPNNAYIHGWVIDAICEHLEAVTYGQIKRLLINVPPGFSKSLLLNVLWPAWEWGPKSLPHYRYISASHMQNLSVRDNLKMKRLVTSQWYQDRYGSLVRLTRDQNTKTKFENTAGGFREAMAANSMTGSRGERILLDDPLSVDDSLSEAVLLSREYWFTESVPTRLNNPEKSAIIVIMQRLTQRDTSGIIIERKFKYDHLMLPMEFEEARRCSTSIGFVDPRKTEGELLFPERFPPHVVEELKITLGSFASAGQLQQRPAPREGGLIKMEWFKRFRLLRDNFGNIDLKPYKLIYQSWDTAFKDGEQNDFSVCLTWGLKDDGFYLLARWKNKVLYPELETNAIILANQFKPNQILIEDKASGQSLVQSLRKRTTLPIKPIQVDRDKLARVHACSPFIESGKVWLPEDEWVQDYIDELTTFPSSKHDDSVDATTLFLMRIALNREGIIGHSNINLMGR